MSCPLQICPQLKRTITNKRRAFRILFVENIYFLLGLGSIVTYLTVINYTIINILIVIQRNIIYKITMYILQNVQHTSYLPEPRPLKLLMADLLSYDCISIIVTKLMLMQGSILTLICYSEHHKFCYGLTVYLVILPTINIFGCPPPKVGPLRIVIH